MNTSDRLYAVRGAVCCENTVESIASRVSELYSLLITQNSVSECDIVSVQFTMTADLDALNPATALRKAGMAASVPLFAAAEPFIRGGMPRVVRILLTYYGSRAGSPVYLHGAEKLRPDLIGASAGV